MLAACILTVVLALGPPVVAAAASPPGIPFGPFQLPESLFRAPYTGAYWRPNPDRVIAMLTQARTAGLRVVLNLSGPRDGYKTDTGAFSLAKWKGEVDRFRHVDLRPFIADGTIVGHYLMDEPHARREWDGRPVPLADLDAAAEYSKQLWPAMPTLVRSHPEFLEGFRYRFLDAGWAQYSASKGDVRAYVADNVRSARAQKLGLVLGLNVLDGGTSESGIPGPTRGKWSMSAAQIEAFGTALAAEPYACGLFMWKYDRKNPAYFEREDIRAAMASVARVAARRDPTGCARREPAAARPER